MPLDVLQMNPSKRPFDEIQEHPCEYGKRIKEGSLLSSKRAFSGSFFPTERSKKSRPFQEEEEEKVSKEKHGALDLGGVALDFASMALALVPYKKEGVTHHCPDAASLIRIPFPIYASGGCYEICSEDDKRLQPSDKNALVVHPTMFMTRL
ncbi:hypothetical protein MDAP_001622 [Mitosporidium daphniae]|uniref:Uncharacterized protein n=1 Tax=Mitosporidium daphniae TaxID=1485682 RepID=A0A098VQ08_9MICR|nr:uncharacterized protein DI09_43p170 [Mitosporidium daphniae]KGG51142.1 hypothetical protein DI09_43p170 [Mitosporidium daphniae]|eukprot:XP_013237569.1 uncharacterized protein DI09_43p170 [Mitosporidium daphniae]